MKTRLMSAALLCVASWGAVALAQAKEPMELGFAVYKLGEVNATDEMAGKPIDDLCAFLDTKVEGAKFVRRGVRNKPDDALKLLKDEKLPVAAAIVSPGFYLAHKDTLKLTALGEARRGGFNGEQFVLRGKARIEGYPYGKRVATNLAAEPDWLNKVVLPMPAGGRGKPVEWVHYNNLMDAGYEIADAEDEAPDFVLLDRVSAKVFDEDQDLKTLKSGWQGEVLPQELVVEVDGRLGAKRDGFKQALAGLDGSDAGKKLGVTLQTANFPAPDEKRIAAAQKLYGLL